MELRPIPTEAPRVELQKVIHQISLRLLETALGSQRKKQSECGSALGLERADEKTGA